MVSGDNVRDLGGKGGSNHHVIVGITDHHRDVGEVGNKGSKVAEPVNELCYLFVRIAVALTVASLFIKQDILCFFKNCLREDKQKSS